MTPGTRTEPCNKIPYFVALPAVTSIGNGRLPFKVCHCRTLIEKPAKLAIDGVQPE